MGTLTTVAVDRETKARLEILAGKKPMARYLRELSLGMSGTGPESILEALEDIEKQVTRFRQIFFPFYRKNIQGKFVPVTLRKEAKTGQAIPMIHSSLIDEALEENPDAKQAGWYNKTVSGEWELDEKRFQKHNKRRLSEKAAIAAAQDEIEAKGGDLNKVPFTAQKRQELIKRGMEILKDKENES